MNPVAFSIFGLDIRWYGIFISAGIIIGILVSIWTTKINRVNFDKMTDALLISLPFGIIGARLYYVLFNWGYYSKNLWQIIDIRQGGLAIHGGLILGVLSALIYMKINGMDFLKYLDAAAPSISIAQSIGRWGNFFNQEAHGGEVSKAFISIFPEFIQKGMYIEGMYYHPTFLYESIWNLINFIILIFITKIYNKQKGIIFAYYIAIYSFGRLLIEGLRTDSLMIGPLRIAQVISLVFLSASIYFIRFKIKNKSSE
ncbi:Prolipoprotein diacylglyceryl transferase [Caloramator mitchellensis]|uniref:Phosphatidylglycerol--prolipoprotein diacylglyceryl transferase n=1 Tax=Caloramator mitchellensis TaxID=908809 RepID=A0A0R3K360_CALMK|nr:prolipoprotein diacylglyceryl transferase [Caloramator mitchellensis]KRQ86751.1 Prolipoprotein diacylglyceryl transferase [Caloramator mitchellensis]